MAVPSFEIGSKLFDTDTVLPRLRSDLIISRQVYRGRTAYVVKDPVSLRYYRLGQQELFLAGLLDGERTLGEATELMQKEFPTADITEERVAQLLTLFAQMSYLQLHGEQAQRMFERLHEARHKHKLLRRLFGIAGSVMYFKMTLYDPDLLLLKLEKRLRFLWDKKSLLALAGLLLVALAMVFSNYDRLRERMPDFLTLHNLILLWATLVGVKVFHEFGHGLICKHYGGEVHQMGAMFIVLTPFLFCDATDSWMFRNKWHKIAVGLGGILVELFLAASAAIVWVLTQPGLLNQLALNVMVVCSFTTVVFNANPLMKFDGYYVLADFLEIPNLRDRARKHVVGLATQWFTGRPAATFEESTPWRQGVFVAYAVASYLYTWYIICRIFRIMGAKFQPYGLETLGRALIVVTYTAGIVIPLWVFARQLGTRFKSDPSGFVSGRWLKLCGAVAVIFLLLAVCPWPLRVTSSCILAGTNRVSVNARSAGFLREVFVREGQRVRQGEALARLENDELQERRRDAEDDLQIIEIKQQAAAAEDAAASMSRLNAQRSQQLAVLDTLRTNAAALELKAPVTGTVLTAELQDRRGTYLHEGDEFCQILPEGKINLVIALNEREVGLVRTGQPVEFCLYSLPGKPFRGRVTKTFMAVTRELPHPALAARFGGDVPTEIDISGHEQPSNPFYQAELQIENSGNFLRPGLSGCARIQCGRTTPLRIVVSHLTALLRLG